MQTCIYDLKTQYEKGMDEAARAIQEGELVAMPTETVYGLAADAQNACAVEQIFLAKGRPQDNPLIVHIDRIEELDKIAFANKLAEKLAKAFWPGPLTLVVKKRPGMIPDVVTCGMDTVAVRLPKSAYARELIARSGRYIAAPSANISGRPSPTRASHVMEDFLGKIPIILDGGECEVGLESTVVAVYEDKPVILRPGGITEDMIKEVAGEVEISPAVLGGLKEGQRAASPGMKYKHYSPKAEVVIADGSTRRAIANATGILYDKYSKNGKVLILCSADMAEFYDSMNYKVVGKTPEDFAHVLFDELRRADEEKYDAVILEAVKPIGMGLAVMNRALRSAGFKVVKGDE